MKAAHAKFTNENKVFIKKLIESFKKGKRKVLWDYEYRGRKGNALVPG